MRKLVLALGAFICMLTAIGQVTYNVSYTSNSGNPGGLNTDNDFGGFGWTNITTAPQSANSWSQAVTLPFPFEFYGVPVNQYKVSQNGLLTFDTSATLLPNANTNLPTAALPVVSICAYWDEFTDAPPTGNNDIVQINVYGASPNQQLWIKWRSFEIGQPATAASYWAIVLEETTFDIHIVDMNFSSGSPLATVGVQFNDTTAVQAGNDSTMFNAGGNGPGDNDYWTFSPVGVPNAKFTASDTTTCNGTINFYDESSYGPTQWEWDFGDGGSDTVQNPTYAYTVAGTYTVTLIARNGVGADTIIKTSYIDVTLGGPMPACVVTTTGWCCQAGIINVEFDSISNSSSNGSVGYEDFSCAQSTTLTQGDTVVIEIETGPNLAENLRIWLDMDNSGTFDAGEEIFSSDNVVGIHTGSYVVPYTTALSIPLRMRVGSDMTFSPDPLPCVDVAIGQFEDYTVIIVQDTVPPVADFESDVTITCDSVVNLTDLSTKTPGSWFWDFGDSNTDTVQHPTHKYADTGTYTITLIATNAFGSDTMIKTNLVQVITNGAVAPSCTPSTTGWCCGFGITNVTLESINNTTGDGSQGYMDYSCSAFTDLYEGVRYTLSVTVDTPSAHNVRAWIDWNNNGSFSASEEVFAKDNTQLAIDSFLIPTSAVQGSYLRMRISADYDFEPVPAPCSDLKFGQAEDYSVRILPNPFPPDPTFSWDVNTTCDGVVSFTDLSNNAPTSWYWDFGDGNTDTVQNPTHTYTTNGTYHVMLKATNANGADSLVEINAVTVTLGNKPIAPGCAPVTTAYCCDYGMYSVLLGSINNTTAHDDGYQDYSCEHQTDIKEGKAYAINFVTNPNNPQEVKVWVDLDNDGIFDPASELIFEELSGTNPSGTFTIPFGSAMLDTLVRMRVSTDFVGANLSPCSDPQFGQVEDYGLTVIENDEPPIVDFETNSTTTCDGEITFTDLTTNGPVAWLWDFGDGDTSNVQHPSHTYTATGFYTVELTAWNAHGSGMETKFAYINVQSVSGGPIPPVCKIGGMPSDGIGITLVRFNTINNLSTDAGYQDFACSQQTTIMPDSTYELFVKTGFPPPEAVVAFIDWNGDGTFDTTEQVMDSPPSFTGDHTAFVTVPSTVPLGTWLRMRVVSAGGGFGGPPTACTSTNGDMEDYGVKVDTVLSGIGKITFGSGAMQILPNPSNGQFTIEHDQSQPLNVVVWNSVGQVVKQARIQSSENRMQMDLSGEQSGVYLIRLYNERVQMSEKIVIQK